MKKVLGFLLMCCLVLALAACGADSGTEKENTPQNNAEDTAAVGQEPVDFGDIVPEEGAELVVWESSGPEKEFMEYAAQKFEEEYGIPVRYEEVGFTDSAGKLEIDGPAGLGADVFAAPHDHLGAMVSAGLILENFFPEEYEGEFMDAATVGTTMEGLLYGYPTAIETYGLFYNKDLVQELPETMEDLIAMASDFTDVDAGKYGFMAEVDNLYFMYAFIGGYGGYIFGDNNTDPTEIGLNNEGAVKAGELFQRLNRELLPLNSEDITYDIKGSLFEDGKLMFDLNGPWAVSGYRDAGLNFGVMPLPRLDNDQVPTSFSGVRGLYVNAYTKYPDAASLFARFATSEEMLLKRYEMTGQLPPRLTLMEDPIIKDDPVSSAFLAQAEYAVPMPNIPEMPKVWDPMKTALSLIWSGTSPQDALDNAVKQINDSIR